MTFGWPVSFTEIFPLHCHAGILCWCILAFGGYTGFVVGFIFHIEVIRLIPAEVVHVVHFHKRGDEFGMVIKVLVVG